MEALDLVTPRDDRRTTLQPRETATRQELTCPDTAMERLKHGGTRDMLPFMELPIELRLEIYEYLLNFERTGQDIIIECRKKTPCSPSPTVAILQTCRQINDEGTPILYAHNKFIFVLSMETEPNFHLTQSFLLRSLRWSSLACLTSITFTSANNSKDPADLPPFTSSHFPKDSTDPPPIPYRSRPSFTTYGAEILARFPAHDRRYSPAGPDKYMALSISNWVSTKVMMAHLNAIQKELEETIKPFVLPGSASGDGDADGDDLNVMENEI